jgi:hypothetical protein
MNQWVAEFKKGSLIFRLPQCGKWEPAVFRQLRNPDSRTWNLLIGGAIQNASVPVQSN